MAAEDDAEKKPLLDAKATEPQNVYPRNYIIHIVLIFWLFGGSIGSSAFSQFVVKYFKENTANSSTVISSSPADNVTDDQCNDNSTKSQENTVQKESADFLKYLKLVEYAFLIPALVFFGIYVEIYGRKLFMVVSLCGTFISHCVNAFVIYFDLSINWIYVGHICAGILGTGHGFYMCCSLCIADVTDTGKSRTFQLALLHYFQGIGLTGSQISAGYIITRWGYAIPCMIAAGVSIIAGILLATILKETLHTSNTTERSCLKVSKSIIICCNKEKTGETNSSHYIIVFLSLVCVLFPADGRSSIDILYLLGSPFCLTPKEIGWYEAAREFMMLSMGTGVLKLLLFCLRDEVIGMLGCASGILYYCGMAFATNIWMLYASVGCGVLSLVPMPLLRAVISKMVSREKQGPAFANIYVTEAVCSVISSTMFFTIYAETRPIFKGIVYFVFSVFNLGCIILLIPVMVLNNRKKKQQKLEVKINAE